MKEDKVYVCYSLTFGEIYFLKYIKYRGILKATVEFEKEGFVTVVKDKEKDMQWQLVLGEL